MLSSKPENWSFHVFVLMSTREKCLHKNVCHTCSMIISSSFRACLMYKRRASPVRQAGPVKGMKCLYGRFQPDFRNLFTCLVTGDPKTLTPSPWIPLRTGSTDYSYGLPIRTTLKQHRNENLKKTKDLTYQLSG